MKRISLAVLMATVAAFAISGSAVSNVCARPPDPNKPRLAANLPHLPNPFRGKTQNVTPNNVVVIGDKGPTGTFVIQAGTRILRDGKPIIAVQIFVGDPIQVSFTLVKETGLMQANEIIVGNLPYTNPDAPASGSRGGDKKKKNK